MSDEEVDTGRRRFLTATTSVVGGVGLLGAGVAGVMYMSKSERTLSLGAPVNVNIGKLKPGEQMIAEWRSQPIWILRRTSEMLADLDSLKNDLKDPDSENNQMQPDYAKNAYRAIRKEYFVVIGICTHLGCSPTRKEIRSMSADWKGGYLCACHGSTFDYAGRVFNSVPAQDNLKIPPHYYHPENKNILIVGIDEGAKS